MNQPPPSHLGIKLYRVVLWIMPSCLALAIVIGWGEAFSMRRFPASYPPEWLLPTVFFLMLAAIVAMGFGDARLSGNPSFVAAALDYIIIQCIWLLLGAASSSS